MPDHKSLEIKPIELKDYSCKQSVHSHVPTVPLRMILLAPSGSGKTVLLSNLVLNIYRNCFERIYIFSPSIDVDKTWEPVKEYQAKIVDEKNEKLYFNHYDPSDLENIIETQHKVIKLMKDHKSKNLFSILIVVDDFADDPSFTRRSKLLHSLFTRGRHNSISTIVRAQKFSSIHPIIRVNATALVIYRLRNEKEVQAFLEEVSGLITKHDLLDIYKLATDEPYSFLYIDLMAVNIDTMFYKNFTTKFSIE